ncbi:2-C-methyl-D-erythritol 4-phosphate cytidylyltransferase [Marinobacter persicus]|uniref:2-C-methyl-D-erythritol 4-phosphate cytidylyltransferase n=1 Tax=Marinobacter persicus TaxID=930118 RepID=A0A1I3Y5Z6_9GAMM|nr:2-C-methyl-D-erythritol 4-phosphate cytidylyltransferase [Marinobacter persicus]GHD53209.1 2-C-methyl-D-erythritol 4-phosphate cytidylyltransferase [Marinobacter persicus]SFK26646.1 2-C-methyl-D-erythritol 4-phosphate cytidylyltransferase [Marinobacter persicus]
MVNSRFWLVVPAAGIGQRMRSECPKQYLKLHQRFILDVTLSRLLDSGLFDGCMVALNPRDRWWPDSVAAGDERVQTCTGGAERADSVLAALQALAGQAADEDWVLVHDAARPCLHPHDLSNLVDSLVEHPVGGLLAAPVADTLKQTGGGQPPEVDSTVDRSRLWRAFTPQMFRLGALRCALASCLERGLPVTDESSAMEFSGYTPVLVEGRSDNIKITVPADLALAEFLLAQQDG